METQIIISFGTLLYAIQRGSSDGWTSPRILALLSLGFVAFLAFIIVELRVKDPLLDLRLFAKRTYLFANMLGWVSAIALFGAEFLLPIYLQTLRGRTPLEAGLLVLPLAISSGIVVPIAGFLYNRIGPRWLIAFGSLLLAVNTFELAHIGVDTSYLEIMIIVAIRGVALGCVLQTTLTAALTGLRTAQLPRASSLLNSTRNVFQSFGIALLGTIITTQFAIYEKASVSDIHDPATSLGKQFIHSVQALIQQGLPSFAAQKAAMGQLIGTIFNPHGPIFQVNFITAINDAYWLTFWLSVVTLALAFTLPGRSKIETGTSGREEALSPAPIREQI